MRVILKAIINY